MAVTMILFSTPPTTPPAPIAVSLFSGHNPCRRRGGEDSAVGLDNDVAVLRSCWRGSVSVLRGPRCPQEIRMDRGKQRQCIVDQRNPLAHPATSHNTEAA
jgi:hypothetical protein